jgi:prepilin-type N-terminal cleavage/methylation domain-containing protein
MTHRSSSRCRGFTLTELAIVLGVIGVILSAIWVAASAVYANKNTARAVEQVLQIVNGFRAMYGAHQVDSGPWQTNITSMAISNGIMPSDMIQSGNTFNGIGPWGGSTVQVLSGSQWNVIAVQYSGLSQQACNDLADALITGGNPQLVYAALPGGAAWFSLNGNSPYFTTSQISQTYCQAGSGNYVQLMYTMN